METLFTSVPDYVAYFYSQWQPIYSLMHKDTFQPSPQRRLIRREPYTIPSKPANNETTSNAPISENVSDLRTNRKRKWVDSVREEKKKKKKGCKRGKHLKSCFNDSDNDDDVKTAEVVGAGRIFPENGRMNAAHNMQAHARDKQEEKKKKNGKLDSVKNASKFSEREPLNRVEKENSRDHAVEINSAVESDETYETVNFPPRPIVNEWINKLPTVELLKEMSEPYIAGNGICIVIDDFVLMIDKQIEILFTILSHSNKISVILLTQN